MRSFLVMGLAITGFALIAAGAFLIAYRSIKRAQADLATANNSPAPDGGDGGGGGGTAAYGIVRLKFNPLDYAEPISKLRSGDRLIAWGLVLLVLACVVSGFLDFSVGEPATAGE